MELFFFKYHVQIKRLKKCYFGSSYIVSIINSVNSSIVKLIFKIINNNQIIKIKKYKEKCIATISYLLK